MDKIPVHKASELLTGEIAALLYVSEHDHDHDSMSAIDYAHRDDYYIFIFLEKGTAKLTVDFEEQEITENTVLRILPGQVHAPLAGNDYMNVCGWFLMADSMLVSDEYKDVFEKSSFVKGRIKLTDIEASDLKQCISIIGRRLDSGQQPVGQNIVHTLLSSYIGMIAEIYRRGFPVSANNRPATITSQFKSLLSANYQTLKRPSEYASRLNISPAYLNEAVKKTAGLSAGDCIRNEIVLQAKRLLFYTNLSVKEIAYSLGYDDYAYFTRLFTKSAGLSPTQFKANYRK
jgi:AraC-like DNA-binding protein